MADRQTKLWIGRQNGGYVGQNGGQVDKWSIGLIDGGKVDKMAGQVDEMADRKTKW